MQTPSDSLPQSRTAAQPSDISYASVWPGNASWDALEVADSATYQWSAHSTYIKRPTFLQGMSRVRTAGTFTL